MRNYDVSGGGRKTRVGLSYSQARKLRLCCVGLVRRDSILNQSKCDVVDKSGIWLVFPGRPTGTIGNGIGNGNDNGSVKAILFLSRNSFARTRRKTPPRQCDSTESSSGLSNLIQGCRIFRAILESYEPHAYLRQGVAAKHNQRVKRQLTESEQQGQSVGQTFRRLHGQYISSIRHR